MAIISISNRNVVDRSHQVKCDFCPGKCSKAKTDPGEAAETARKNGWSTIRSGKRGSSFKWACPSCLQKKGTFE